MSKLLLGIESRSDLERTRPIGHFISIIYPDKNTSLVHSFKGKGRLYYLFLKEGLDSPNLFMFPKPSRRVLDLEAMHYTALPLEFRSERDLRTVSAARLFEYIPKNEIERCGGFEVIWRGLGGYGGNVSAEMRLYKRIK